MKKNSILINGYIKKQSLFNILTIKVTDIFKEYTVIK
jgi:hypothetical protein